MIKLLILDLNNEWMVKISLLNLTLGFSRRICETAAAVQPETL